MRERLRTLVRVASIVSAVTGVWLLVVVASVLPSRDPDRIPIWTTIAVALLAFVALTWFETRSGRQSVVGSVLLWFASSVAVVAGAWILVSAVQRSVGFEGYLVVIGAVLLLHGLTGAAFGAARDRAGASSSGLS